MTLSSLHRRRELLSHALMLVGATAATRIAPEAVARAAGEVAPPLHGEPYATLAALADTIIPTTDTPGALAAMVPQTFAALLVRWAAPATRSDIMAALGRIESTVIARQGKSFSRLDPEARNSFLKSYELEALAADPKASTVSVNPFYPIPPVRDTGYYRIKDLVVSLYYISEIGMTRELIYEHVPGRWVPSLEITPGTHPFASPGPV